jgi:4-hydroxy-L-threonine phosphate dehydrogenase PdxA
MSQAVGLLGPYKADQLLPEEDHCGYEVAVEMLIPLHHDVGLYSAAYTQFNTIQKLRMAFSNTIVPQLR